MIFGIKNNMSFEYVFSCKKCCSFCPVSALIRAAVAVQGPLVAIYIFAHFAFIARSLRAYMEEKRFLNLHRFCYIHIQSG